MIDRSFEPPSAWRDWLAEQRACALAQCDALLGYPALKRRYRDNAGFPLNLDAPFTVGDKINWRKIHDRDPSFPVLADKVRVRDHVAAELGRQAAAELFPKLHLVTDRAEDIDFDRLPGDLAIKANHASGWIIILRDGEPVDHDWVRRVCRHWLRRTYAPQKHEWAYRSIPRRILVEELLLGPDGKLPEDIKFHMYDGVCRRCTVETGRDGEKLLACHYTPEWQLYDRANETAARDGKLAPERPRPVRLDAMRAVAERLSAGLDYLRVDFLDLGERFTMTELTLYPASGAGGTLYERDVEVGKHWRNPRWPTASASWGG
jgi:TupA-like ATPgrasp